MYHSSSPKKIDKGIYHDFISFNFSIFFWVYYNLCFFCSWRPQVINTRVGDMASCFLRLPEEASASLKIRPSKTLRYFKI